MKMLVKHGAALGMALVVASPAFAHWGPASAWRSQGQAATHCAHSSPARRVRIHMVRHIPAEECVEHPFTGRVCWATDPLWDDAVVKNVSGTGIRADILVVATDAAIRRSGFPIPYIVTFQNVSNNGTRLLSSIPNRIGFTFADTQAYCQTSDNM